MMNHIHIDLPSLFVALKRTMDQNAKENYLKHRLSASQLEILWFIKMTGKNSMESIAKHLNIRPPSVTSLVDKMQKSGLVSRKKDPDDRRVTHIILTKKTKEQLDELMKQKKAAFDGMIGRLAPRDKKELLRILSVLIKK